MKRFLSILALPLLFAVSCSSNSLPANDAPAVAQTEAITPLPAENQSTIGYEAPPVVAAPALTDLIPVMPVPACGIPAPLAPVTISCNFHVPPPETGCAEPPYVPNADTDSTAGN